MSERAITALAYATLAILCIVFFWTASTMVLDAIPELQTLQRLQSGFPQGTNQ